MNKNIIRKIETGNIRILGNETLLFPVTLNKNNALTFDAKFIKVVVLPSEFNPKSIFIDNIPVNASRELEEIANDSIKFNEVGNIDTPDFIKKVFSKNIITNLSQDKFSNFKIFIDQTNNASVQEFVVSIPKSRIDLSLKAQKRTFLAPGGMRTGNNSSPTIVDYELPHKFIVYILDSDENILEYDSILPSEVDKKIEDYIDADPDLIKKSLIDEVGSNLDINWDYFNFNRSNGNNQIISGPSIKLDYFKFLSFAKNLDEIINNLDITIEYSNELYNENFFTKIVVPSLVTQTPSSQPMLFLNAIRAIKLSFLTKFAKIEFDSTKERQETTDVSDYFENKFIYNLYRSFESLNIESQKAEMTITLGSHSYTKDIEIRKENFYNFYTRYLDYNEEKIVIKTMKDQIKVSKTVNDLGEFVNKITINKFNYKKYSLNVLNNFAYFSFVTLNNAVIDEIFFDDNCTFENSLKEYARNKFYIKSLFDSENISDFYFKGNSSNIDVINISVNGFNINTDVLGQNIRQELPIDPLRGLDISRNLSDENINQERVTNQFDDMMSIADDLSIVESVDTSNRPSVRGVFGNIRRPVNSGIRESLLQNPTSLIQKNLARSTQVIFQNGSVQFKINQNNLNTSLISNSANLGIDLNNNEITEENKLLKINNNTISTFKYFSNENKFLGTFFKKNSDIVSEDNFKKIFLNDVIKGENNALVEKVEFKNFLLPDGIIDSLTLSTASEQVKENLCRILVDVKPSKYHYIVNRIETKWFNENSDINVVINEIGALLNSSNLENNIVVMNSDNIPKVTKPKSFTTRTKISKKRKVFSKKLNIKQINKIKSSRIIDHIFDFGLNNFIANQLESNLTYNINENFVVKKKISNKKYAYKINLKSNTEFTKAIKSNNFRSLNVYSFYGFEYYNKNITNNKENIAGLNITPNGCLIDSKFIDVITDFEISINKDEVLINNQKSKILNYNENYYNLVKSIWENSKSLKVKSVINRLLFEVVLNNGEKEYFGLNINLEYNKKFSEFKSLNNKSNLFIDINNDKLRNPNIILKFGK